MIKAVFLDRDGTINVDYGYVHDKEHFDFIPGAIDTVRCLYKAGYAPIIVTNQSGIGRGYYTVEDYHALNEYMTDCFRKNGVEILDNYYCPHHPQASIAEYRQECNCRKPAIGLFLQAVKDHDIDLSQSIAIGDNLRDLTICDVSKCRGFLICNNADLVISNPAIQRVDSITQISELLGIDKRY